MLSHQVGQPMVVMRKSQSVTALFSISSHHEPSPDNITRIIHRKFSGTGVNRRDHDIRFVEDNWESPTLGAWGVGWEVWLNGMEITQFTYFQQCGGLECNPISVELTYGLERLAMYIQNVDHVMDIAMANRSK